tara:strand:+ start:118 stop:1512 length:1395 start_codon:yes stop_codon:yes gene_type:complete
VSLSFEKFTLQACLQTKMPRKELIIASIGCLLGTTLLFLAIQLHQDAQNYLEKSEGPKNFFTINKKVEGGALVNLGKQDESFSPEELKAIRKVDGVKRVGGFVRNQFPLTLHIWPSGKVGFGAAAKTDLFFESIPEEFLDFTPQNWDWDENSSIIPIIVPKFYLDLWNFGLAPSRVEYPSLSMEAAMGMPIQVFIGKNRQPPFDGRFVAFSKRINSVLVPKKFLDWANEKYGQPVSADFYFLWKSGSIEGAPLSKEQLLEMSGKTDFETWEVSPLGSPADRSPISSVFKVKENSIQPSRIILEIENNPSPELLQFIKGKKYEMNREFPEQDLIKKALLGLFLGVVAIGALLSLLSIATFATSYRLVIAKSAEHAGNLLLLGFSNQQISKVFFSRFTRLFFGILILSLSAIYLTKNFLIERANEIGIEINGIISSTTIFYLCIYTILFLLINKQVIEKSISSLLD